MKEKYHTTKWEIIRYDVWGDAEEGYEVNDRFRIGIIEFRNQEMVWNAGTEQEFRSVELSELQIKRALDIEARASIDVDGDDRHYYVTSADDGYPLGELQCISHDSLSPIRSANDNC